MFENVLGQSGVDRLTGDIAAGILAPAMLFAGPPASGKGTAALELGRIISCEVSDPARAKAGNDSSGQRGGAAPSFGKAAWNCGCSACSRHRLLLHPDLLCLGPRAFSAEIAASAGTFLRDRGSSAAYMLFVRAVRKLLARFNPAFWGDAAKGAKALSSVSSLVNSLEEDLDELDRLSAASVSAANQDSGNAASFEKLTDRMLKSAFKLEAEGVSDTVPIGQLRRAAYWCHLAPAGRGKLLVIENADRMQEEARNSLLKLLEEPPPHVTLALTSARPGSLLPTILSRLRPYRFRARNAEVEGEVIRRVFRDQLKAAFAEEDVSSAARPDRGNRIGAYLDSFLPVSGDTLEAAAACFAASAAYKAALLAKRQGRSLPEEIVLLGKFCAPKAEAAGLGRPREEGGALVSLILEKTNKFEIRSLFSRFFRLLLEQVSLSQRQGPLPFLPSPAYNEIWKKASGWAESAVMTYKISPAQALEKCFTDLSRGMAAL